MSDNIISIAEFSTMPDDLKRHPDVLENVTTGDLKTLLSEYNLSPMAKNSIITELMNREPGFKHDLYPEIEESEADKVYPALNFIAFLLKFAGWVYIIIAFVSAAKLFSSGSEASAVIGILVLAGALFLALMSFAIAETIKVFTDISSSAFKILQCIKKN